jgi:tRNA (uracil-5-)-methyltransferase TRM9
MTTRLDFYETHGAEFSKSRYAVWPQVQAFLDALPSGAKVLDIGCGNGKNMLARADLCFTGVEPSAALCAICAERGLSVVQADARDLPFKEQTFDAVIMIAVLHHLTPESHSQALCEIQRVLTPGGKALITNWAVEQPENSRRAFTPGLNNVAWKGKECSPLPYWVMNKSMAVDFVYNLPSSLACQELELVAGNWSFTLEKSKAMLL